MKYLKISVVILVVSLFCFGLSASVQAQAERDEEQICSDMTYAQLATIIIQTLDLPFPEGFNEMTEGEQFEAQINLLAEQGVTDFDGYEPNGKVTRGFAAEVMVKALRIPQKFESIDDQIGYLANLGYISRGGVEEIITDCDMEAYTPPPAPSLPDQPDPVPEPVSSVQ
ncbi:MAG: hypothetical protein P9M07_02770 [Candidatus Aceula meridiana]|nr:hypothetical protein [Candidatus Aceula meridiana]